MHHGRLPWPITLLLILVSFSSALPAFNNTLWQRDDPPPVPDRPAGIAATSFHGSQFVFLEQTGYAPAVAAAPVFLFSRTGITVDPCYPESAVVLGSNPPMPNPGTDGPKGTASANPGADCTNPGPYTGAYSLGQAFPVYIYATWCSGDDTWRINYSLYYVHDGHLETGHKHDWESTTVVWKRDDSTQDWWHRDSVIMSEHKWHNHFGWGDIQTVDVDVPGMSDVTDETTGAYKAHPKAYIGFFSHANFPQAYTGLLTQPSALMEDTANTEYRSNDWWRLPRLEDMHSWKEIHPDWNYGEADSTPPKIASELCTL